MFYMEFINKIVIELEHEIINAKKDGEEFRCRDVSIELQEEQGCMACYIKAQTTPLSYVRLYFKKDFSDKAFIGRPSFFRFSVAAWRRRWSL